jgi:hypothetical protein
VRTPDGWPERPSFGRFRTQIVDKPDGRRVTYYDWPDEANRAESVALVASGGDAPSRRQKDDGV